MVPARGIDVASHDVPGVVDAAGLGPDRAGHIDRAEASRGKQEPMFPGGGVDVESHDVAGAVDPEGVGQDRPWNIDRGKDKAAPCPPSRDDAQPG